MLRDDDELGGLVDPATDAPVEAAVRRALPFAGFLLDTVPRPLIRRAAHAFERLVSPGFITHYALRKHAVREQLLRAIGAGARQVVLVGAGFDMLASAVPKGVRVFELDHPATQRARREALGGTPASDVTFVAVDLAKDRLRDALLAAPAFDADADTVFVAEGLLMYLEPEYVDAVLADMCLGCASHTLILTIITPDARNRLRLHSQRKVVDWCMRWLDEPFVWGERRERLPAILEHHGLAIESVLSTAELRDVLLSAPARRRMPRATGELIVIAKRPRTGADVVRPPERVAAR